jgi:sugar phosphate isomerase/epimerase
MEEPAGPLESAVPRPVALQMYTLRDLPLDYASMLRLAAELGFVGVEVGDFHGLPPAEIRRIVDDLGLEVCAVTLPREGDVEAAVHDLNVLGASSGMLTLPESWFATPADVQRAVDRMHEVSTVCSQYGARLLYHNHFWELTRRFDGVPALTLFLDELRRGGLEPQLEVDIYWAQTAGVSPADLLRQLGSAVKHLHVKDGPCTTTDPMTAVGTGAVDVAAALRANPSVEWHIVELDECGSDMVQAVSDSYRYLVSSGLSTGAASV